MAINSDGHAIFWQVREVRDSKVVTGFNDETFI